MIMSRCLLLLQFENPSNVSKNNKYSLFVNSYYTYYVPMHLFALIKFIRCDGWKFKCQELYS